MLKVLLNNRANMDKADANQKRPIELACENSYISIFSLLKLYGARIDGPIVSTFFDDNYRQIDDCMNKISGRGSSQPQISRVNHPTINSNSQFNFPQQQSGQQQRNVYSHAPKNQQLASSPPQNTPPVSTIPQSVQLTINKMDSEIQNLKEENIKLKSDIADLNTKFSTLFSSMLKIQYKFQQSKSASNHYWQSKQKQFKKITSLEQVTYLKNLGSGSDGMVFECRAKIDSVDDDITRFAVKIIYNISVPTINLKEACYQVEYSILKALPFHNNVIPLLTHFEGKPTPEFYQHFPQCFQEQIHSPNGSVRSTIIIITPCLTSFDEYFRANFKTLTKEMKLRFIMDIISAQCFLFKKRVVHRDMKLNNILIDSYGNLKIHDFGYACQLSATGKLYLSSGQSLGGNTLRLAPEIRSAVLNEKTEVDYSGQPSYELSILAYEIYFGDSPSYNDVLSIQFLNSKCDATTAPPFPELFEWISKINVRNLADRLGLLEAKKQFQQILHNI